jgi:hypothetical protein
MKIIQLTVYDDEGLCWTIPGELIETRFQDHQFAVHKSLSTSNNSWVVTHVETGASLAEGQARMSVINAALEKLSRVSADQFNKIISQTREKVARVSGQQQRKAA